jgi:hypothetical protein
MLPNIPIVASVAAVVIGAFGDIDLHAV